MSLIRELRKLAVAALSICVLAQLPSTLYATEYQAPASDVMRLPKFCWGQYNSKLKGPKYNIERATCGVYTNHYCPGLIMLNQSLDFRLKPGARRQLIQRARGAFEYTWNGIKNLPACKIRTHVLRMHKLASRMQIEMARQ